MVSAFPQSLGIGDMTTTRNGKLSDNTQFIDVFSLKVGAQQVKAFGNGSIVGGVDNRGILYISLKDNTGTPVQLEGKIRLALRNANGNRTEVILEELTEKLRASKTDKTQAYMLGLIDALKAKQDSYLIIQFLARDATTAGKTITDANCDLVLPVTSYAL
ncbi:hypothetical protein [uncultured Methanoregula sp.]|uniref:hypothetical protein n=1 Tax=uncultured Methanoregula sp. TaxID=1005933 RepID=UPI002AAC01B9|nr:hypothetical protein [uncultured Methanoregula sp.]